MLLLPNPKKLLLGYWLGAMTMSITVGLVTVFALKNSSLVHTTKHTISPIVDLALGAIFLVIALALRTGEDTRLKQRRAQRKAPKQDKGPPRWQRALDKGNARQHRGVVFAVAEPQPGGRPWIPVTPLRDKSRLPVARRGSNQHHPAPLGGVLKRGKASSGYRARPCGRGANVGARSVAVATLPVGLDCVNTSAKLAPPRTNSMRSRAARRSRSAASRDATSRCPKLDERDASWAQCAWHRRRLRTYQPFRPMSDRSPGTYRQSIIAYEPNTESKKESRKKESRKTVSLTPAETRVLTLLPTYQTLSAIGDELGIGRPTVKTHVEHIYKKLGATTRAEAVKLAESAGLLPRRGPRSQRGRLGRPS